ncbi:hypothetical protein, partial [Escherichia fergusonii]|uniref:hypothetical protein n=1 Tax=Escherichia fergusonii TaxID=564 RepID=UPI00222F135F
ENALHNGEFAHVQPAHAKVRRDTNNLLKNKEIKNNSSFLRSAFRKQKGVSKGKLKALYNSGGCLRLSVSGIS